MRKFSNIFIWVLLSLALLGISGVFLWPKLYYAERDQMLTKVSKLKGITDVRAFGNEDVTYELFEVTFRLVGRPNAWVTIGFVDEDYDVTNAPKNFSIMTLGPWTFHTKEHVYIENESTGQKDKTWSYGAGVDVGSDGRFSSLLPFKLSNVQDVIAHYDDLERIFATWPGSGNPGQLTGVKDRLTGTRDDSLQYYCVKDGVNAWPKAWTKEIRETQQKDQQKAMVQ